MQIQVGVEISNSDGPTARYYSEGFDLERPLREPIPSDHRRLALRYGEMSILKDAMADYWSTWDGQMQIIHQEEPKGISLVFGLINFLPGSIPEFSPDSPKVKELIPYLEMGLKVFHHKYHFWRLVLNPTVQVKTELLVQNLKIHTIIASYPIRP